MLKNNRIPEVTQEIPTQGEIFLNQVLNIGMTTAKLLVGIDTGALLASIQIVKVSKTHYQLSAGKGLPDERALINNYGSYKQAGTNYMSQAAADMMQALVDSNVGFKLV